MFIECVLKIKGEKKKFYKFNMHLKSQAYLVHSYELHLVKQELVNASTVLEDRSLLDFLPQILEDMNTLPTDRKKV